MMAAVIVDGETLASCIYSPGRTLPDGMGHLKGEKDFTFIAEKGVGCFMNGERIRLYEETITHMPDARISFACRNQDRAYEAILAEGVSGYQPRNNASHDYEKLLFGGTHGVFFSEGFTSTLKGKCPPWDHAAGIFMVQEAGGYAALPYEKGGVPYDPLVCHDRVMACCNKELFEDMYRHIAERAPELLQPRQHRRPDPMAAPAPAP